MDKRVIEEIEKINGSYEMEHHKAIYTMEEMYELHFEKMEYVAKNLFLRDDKKRHYYLISVYGDKKVNLKKLKETLGSRPLSFASEKDVESLLGLKKGSLTPFGVLNNTQHNVEVYIDEDYKDKVIGVHPNVNTSTVWLHSFDLINIIKQYNKVEYISIKENEEM